MDAVTWSMHDNVVEHYSNLIDAFDAEIEVARRKGWTTVVEKATEQRDLVHRARSGEMKEARRAVA